MTTPPSTLAARLDGTNSVGRFVDPAFTADGSPRASVGLKRLDTLWFNTGSLCNLECRDCYMESSPRNDRLAYLTAAEVAAYLDEIESAGFGTREIGFTGGEPFLNPQIIPMIRDSLERGFSVLALTNGMRPMMKLDTALQELCEAHGDRLTLRVSLDHYTESRHEDFRGPRTWIHTIQGLKWLSDSGFQVHVAGRSVWGEEEADARAGYGRLFSELHLAIDALDPATLVLFPEMDGLTTVPEITTACWSLLAVDPNSLMCATSRMVVKPKGAERPIVQACTLLPYEAPFALGSTLAAATAEPIALNHPHCSKFCVLGGGACSVDVTRRAP
jgi:uncharacterized Fe-S cluster-containing radical SAM superfamily protein